LSQQVATLGDEFDVESADGDTRDSYLVERGIDTFFIVPQSQTPQLPANRVLHLPLSPPTAAFSLRPCLIVGR